MCIKITLLLVSLIVSFIHPSLQQTKPSNCLTAAVGGPVRAVVWRYNQLADKCNTINSGRGVDTNQNRFSSWADCNAACNPGDKSQV